MKWLALSFLVACAPSLPAALTYPRLDHIQPLARSLPGKVVLVEPHDDRYDAEKQGETMTASLTFAFVAIAYGSYRGNVVTGDDDFVAPRSVSATVGDLLAATYTRAHLGETVETVRDELRWRCADGTCVPDAADVAALAARTQARYVVVARLGHFYGAQFGERSFWAATYQEQRGLDVYQVTQSQNQSSFSGAAGSCVLEITTFAVQDGKVARALRRSYAGASFQSSASLGNRSELASAAVIALGETLDHIVGDLPGLVARLTPPVAAMGDTPSGRGVSSRARPRRASSSRRRSAARVRWRSAR